MKEGLTPDLAGAAGALIYVLFGGFRGPWWNRLLAFACGYLAATFLGPAIVEWLVPGASPKTEAGVHFTVGALALLIYAKFHTLRIAAKIWGVSIDTGHSSETKS